MNGRRWVAPPGSALAKLRIEAHRALDALWAFDHMTRSEAYSRLASAMRLPTAQCHIGMFDEAQCREVIEVCRSGALSE